jgi:hypothetical protein
MWKYEERDHLGDLDIDGRTVISWILRKIGYEGVGKFYLAQGMAEWWGLVTAF